MANVTQKYESENGPSEIRLRANKQGRQSGIS